MSTHTSRPHPTTQTPAVCPSNDDLLEQRQEGNEELHHDGVRPCSRGAACRCSFVPLLDPRLVLVAPHSHLVPDYVHTSSMYALTLHRICIRLPDLPTAYCPLRRFVHAAACGWVCYLAQKSPSSQSHRGQLKVTKPIMLPPLLMLDFFTTSAYTISQRISCATHPTVH